MQRTKAGQAEDSGRNVRPQTDGTQAGLSAALPERSDVQTRHLVLHLRGTAHGEEKKEEEQRA